MGNADPTIAKKPVNELYLRSPHKIELEDERRLHPEIGHIFLPKEKCWCIISFKTSVAVKSAKNIHCQLQSKKRVQSKAQHREVICQVVRSAHHLPRTSLPPKQVKPQKIINTDSLVDLLKKEEKL